MKYQHHLFLSAICAMLFCMCTPKTTEQAQSTPTTPPAKPAVSADPCATFKDSKAGEAALDAHVIYRDFLKRGQFEQAIPYWRQAFTAAPAADGQRTTHFDDGVRIYDYLLSKQTTRENKRVYLDSILYMYDRMGACYPDSYANGQKAFDLYYNYRDLTDNKTIFSLFTGVIDKYGIKTPAFVVNPFTALLVEMYSAKEIDQPTAVHYAKEILAITDKHASAIANAPCEMQVKYVTGDTGGCFSVNSDDVRTPADTLCCALAEEFREGWPIVVGYAPAQLDVFETVKGFYDCAYYKEKYYSSVNLDSVSCDDLPLIGSQLLWGGCSENDPDFLALQAAYQNRCTSTPETDILRKAHDALNEGRYNDAIDLYKQYISTSDNPDKRALYNLFVAKIYYAHLKNFPKAREHARLALKDQPNLGEAYILIGKLYASSGPLCGPGRGWDSQIVTWPAIDMFNKAVSVDPGVASEANHLIKEYSRYMPSVEDIFQRQLQEGQSFQVGCWIQETTTIRAAH